LAYRKLAHDKKWKNVYVEPHDQFLAKNQISHDIVHSRRFKIPCMCDFVNNEKPEVFLCPVRCLRVYKARTDHLRQDKTKMSVC